MKRWSSHDNKFNASSLWVGALDVIEVVGAIDAVAISIVLTLWLYLNLTFLIALSVGMGVHLCLCAVIAITGTIIDRKERRMIEIKRKLCQTLNRLSLNKSRTKRRWTSSL